MVTRVASVRHGAMEIAHVFPTNASKSDDFSPHLICNSQNPGVTIGEKVEVLVGVRNHGSTALRVKAITGSIHPIMNFEQRLQNVSAV